MSESHCQLWWEGRERLRTGGPKETINGPAAAGSRGARPRGTGVAGTGVVECTGTGGAGARDPVGPGGAGAGGTGAGGAGAGGVARFGAGGTGASGAGAGGAGAGATGAPDPRAGGVGAGGAVSGGTGAGGTLRPRSYFVPLLQQVLRVSSSPGLTPPLLCPPPDQSQPPLQPASPLPDPSPSIEQSGGLTTCRAPASRLVSPVRTAHRVPCSCPPPVPGTHAMTLRPSSVPLRVPLPAPPESSLPAVPDPESDRARTASPTVARLLVTAVTDPSFESAAASALVAELLDFAAAYRLDYASALVAEYESARPPSVGGECALAATVPRFASMLLAPEGDPDAPDIPTPRSCAEAITVDGMWIFRVKRPPGFPPTFKARYVARGFRQRQGVDYFHNFSPTPKMTTLRVLLHIAAQRDYELHSLDFSTAFL
ncbi:unnamed protein product [Closterium sp. NIES-54]